MTLAIPAVTIQLYNQEQLNQFAVPVLSSYAEDMLWHVLDHHEIHYKGAECTLVADNYGGYHGNDVMELGRILANHFEEWYNDKPVSLYLFDVVDWLAKHDPLWEPCYEMLERHCAIGIEDPDIAIAPMLYVSHLLVFEFIMHDPNSKLTSICAQHYFEADDSDSSPGGSTYYLSRDMYNHCSPDDVFRIGGAVNSALLDNNATQAASVIMTEVTRLLDGITDVDKANEIHRQLAAMLMDNAPALSDAEMIDAHPHRGNDDAVEVIDLSQL